MTQEISAAQASEYDHIVLVDRSGSMGESSKRMAGKTRWQEASEYVAGLVAFLKDVDEDGITLITFNGATNVTDNVKDVEMVKSVFASQQPTGSTDLAAALVAAERKRATSGKPCFFHVFTDGVPNSEPAAAEAIAKSVRTMKKDADLAISFLQIGDDPDATRFLKRLDDDLKSTHRLEFDVVNTMTAAESESLSYGQIMYMALND